MILKHNRNDFKYSCFKDRMFMKRAILLAKKNLQYGIFPVGCVIGINDIVLSEGVRTKTLVGKSSSNNELKHAEINALNNLLKFDLKKINLSSVSIYSTLEPCLMCFAAILFSGIRRIVFAYEDIMGGITANDFSNFSFLYTDTKINILPNILRKESLKLFKSFFLKYNNIYWSKSKLSKYTLNQKKR